MTTNLGPCVITGGAKGIGFEMAKGLASSGFPVALCSRNDEELQEARDLIVKLHPVPVVTQALDVSDAAAVKSFADFVHSELGNVFALVNNAAVLGPVGPIEQIDLDDANYALAVNVNGIFNTSNAFVPQMKARGGGRIISLSGGGVGGPNIFGRIAAYTTSKFAVAGLTEALARELADHNIQVNAIAPGAQPTSFVSEILRVGANVAGQRLFDDTIKNQGKALDTEKLIELLQFLLAEENNWITGKTLSAQWDSPKLLEDNKEEIVASSLYNLRRIDNELFEESERTNQ